MAQQDQTPALRLEQHLVRAVRPASASRFSGSVLELAIDPLCRELAGRDRRIARITASLAAPGDDTRILCCKDVVQPRRKRGRGAPGRGALTIVGNLAVVTCGPIVGFQEGIIDMSGPGAAYSPFSKLHLVVLEIEVVQGLSRHEHEVAVREAGLAAAERIAAVAADRPPDVVEELRWDPDAVDPALPRLAYVDMVLSQGLLHDTWVLGKNAVEGLPRTLDPRVVLDNGVVSGNCVSACDKNTTFHHQNNPLILALLREHATRWNFVGAVVTNAPTRLAEKRRSARAAVALVTGLRARGAIVSKEGFGNPDADLMMLVRGLEQAGIATVAITDEFAGTDGGSQSLADATAEARAVVSTGNANERLRLPAMGTTIGPRPDLARLAGGWAGSFAPDGTLEVELQAVMGATNELGFGSLSAREY